ncbi:MAG: efflux RND transporter periplasmic adaptor subunit [bacterium]
MRRWLIVGLAALIVIGGVIYLSRPDPIEVAVTQAERGLVEQTVANTRAGTVKACQRSRLSLPIGGQIAQLEVKEGDRVQRGQLLVALWNEDRQARMEQATAARLTAEQEQKSACVSARSDRREANRLERLAREKLVSAERADLANAKADASESHCEALKAATTQAEAEQKLAKSLLDQTYLYAPFDGIVAEVTGELGEYSTPSPPGVATPPAIDLLTAHCHYISAPIDEVDAGSIEPGMPARVTLDAFRDRVFPATVRRVAPYILEQEKQARTVEVEAELNEVANDTQLLAGYSADIEIILETREDVLRVPTELVLEGRYLYVVAPDNELEKRAIEPGIANWRYTEILGGLGANEQIVVDVGSKGVEAGARVSPQSRR